MKAQWQQGIREPDDGRIETPESEEKKKKEPKDRRNMNTTIQDACGYNQRGLLCSDTGVSETEKPCLERYSEK